MSLELIFALCMIHLSIWNTEAALCNNNAAFGETNTNWGGYSGRDSLTGYGFLMLDVNYVVDCCGIVTDWRALVNHQVDQDVIFQVWRPIAGTSNYQLLGQKSYTVTTSAYITASFTQAQRITVKTGDVFGWWTSGSSNVIEYDSGGGEADNNYMQPMSSLAVGATQAWGSATIRNDQTYPVKMSVDANNEPTFLNLNNMVSLSTMDPITTSVFTVSYSDEDKDDVSTLSVSMAPSSKYSFDTTTGIVRTTSILTSFGATTDTLVFRVSDQCANTATATLTVTIINQPPVIHNLPGTTYIGEDVTTETLLYTLNATDPDGSPVSCSLSGTEPVNYPFVVRQIPSSTAYGVYNKYNPGFAYTTTSSYAVNIGCSDGIETDPGTLAVYLIQNPPPVFINLQNASVISTTYEVGASVFQVLVNDTDDLKFTMTCDSSPCPFTIFDSGAILVSSDLTSLTTVGYDLQIWVNDGRTTTGPKTLTVTIADINDPVVITNLPSSVSVAENTAVGTTLFQVSYSDKDIGQLHTVSMTSSPTEGSKYFAINSDGDITVSSMINYEAITAKTFSLAVTVTDPVTSDTKSLSVVVTNVNEPPSFSQSSYTLSAKEGLTGTVLGTPAFGVSDPDSGDTKTLSLDCGNMTGYFSINSNTGQIIYQSDYDLDTGLLPTSIPCVVTVTDGGGLTDTANLLIKITNENDNVPVFSPVSYSFYVNYYAIAGTSVGVVTATDLDISPYGTLTYTLDQKSLSVEHFAINNKGEITVKTSPNGAAMGYATSVTLTAIASDIGGQSDTATVLIFISDTTTTTTTTTTDRYRTFFEDNRNIAWFSSAIGVLLIASVVTFYVVYTCHGPRGCAEFKRTICNQRRIFRRPQFFRRYSFEYPMYERPTRIEPVPVVRKPPPPKEFQFWRLEM